MNFLYSLPLTVNPSPADSDLKSGLNIADVTPGLLGFIVTLFMVLAVVFLIRDMVKRIRRVRYREQTLTGIGSDVFIAGVRDRTAAGTPGAPAPKTPADGQDTTPGYFKRG